MKEWLKYRFMILWHFILLSWYCQAQPESSDNILLLLSTTASSLPEIETNINTTSINSTNSINSTYITIYPQRWTIIVGIVFASLTLLLLTIGTALTLHMRHNKRKSKELKALYYYNSSTLIQHQKEKSSIHRHHLFLRNNKQQTIIIDPQFQSAIQHASMIPSSPTLSQ
ncbi:uncharacterized protein BX664DRAFT_337195 [Halteromyces radiatus]|uniref:uncharacterized protein n=1 Tax=Halteromyces radiatus TaxID=101107 RepID=UPI00221FFA97|nr:uncharacterized protein BX664DRAFT_337195 [Halteromyces radiatus]KAI8084530.1 hypothetical protein BX664DRAFT_337195 [Halteromyces radiatus]